MILIIAGDTSVRFRTSPVPTKLFSPYAFGPACITGYDHTADERSTRKRTLPHQLRLLTVRLEAWHGFTGYSLARHDETTVDLTVSYNTGVAKTTRSGLSQISPTVVGILCSHFGWEEVTVNVRRMLEVDLDWREALHVGRTVEDSLTAALQYPVTVRDVTALPIAAPQQSASTAGQTATSGRK